MELMRSLLLKSDFYYIRIFFLKHGHLSWENSVVSKFTGILFILSALNTPLDNSDSSLFDVGKKGFFIGMIFKLFQLVLEKYACT